LSVTSARAQGLVDQLRAAAAELIALVEDIDAERWEHVPSAGVWSVSKDAEHVGDGAVYHQWIVHRTLGHRVPARRPGIERELLTARLSQPAVVELLRRCTDEGTELVQALTDAQLDLPPDPPRARLRTLAELIESVLIGHYRTHREEIESKLRASGATTWRGGQPAE
jgi:uncharacterized damage-inducible protein DinB